MDSLEQAMLSRLRMLDEDAYNALPDAGEGLGGRLCQAAHYETSLDGVLSAAKTKRYALSRIRRMCMCAALGINAHMARGIPPYARVLAANERGRLALKRINERSLIPVITKPASVKELSRECQAAFSLGSLAHDFFVLGYQAAGEKTGGGDWRATPAML
jgi:predicted nucleotidyltransferase